MTYVLFFIGIGLLVKGADWLVDGASALAKRWGVSSLLIGLTVVAFGTSMPEFVVSMIGALNGESSIVFGNIVGSNIINTLFILGLATIIYPPRLTRITVWREIPFSLLAAVLLFALANNFFAPGSELIISRGEGAHGIAPMSLNRIGIFIALGVLCLYVGGIWTVDGATQIARSLGVSSFLIAATIVTIGISLPELVTSIRATVRLDTDMAVGNIVGSNIFNIFWIMGVTSFVRPVPTPLRANFDMLFLVLVTTLLFLFLFVGEKQKLNRWQGLALLLLYGVYLSVIIARG
jgi:cation:H+ antiporter